jgi:hypothetical protein
MPLNMPLKTGLVSVPVEEILLRGQALPEHRTWHRGELGGAQFVYRMLADCEDAIGRRSMA